MLFPPEAWWQWGNEMLGRNYRSTSEQQWRRWRQSYGTASPQVMSDIWDRCAADVPKSRPEHMLWAIIFLKTYGTESDMCDKVRNPNRPDEKTFRHWVWKWIKAISAESSIIVSSNMHRFICMLFIYLMHVYVFFLQAIIMLFFRSSGRTGTKTMLGTNAARLWTVSTLLSTSHHHFGGGGIQRNMAARV